jgi:hypothetical protein
MNEETVVTQEQHDVSGNDLVVRCTLNREQITRPHGGKHAHSPCLEAYGTLAAKHVGYKAGLRILMRFRRVRHREQLYELIRLCMHEKLVGSILPQESAMVSKTRSCRNAGSW